MSKEHVTAQELEAILGERWAICRNTEKNRERYGRCITQKEYDAACVKALAKRRDELIQELAAALRTIANCDLAPRSLSANGVRGIARKALAKVPT